MVPRRRNRSIVELCPTSRSTGAWCHNHRSGDPPNSRDQHQASWRFNRLDRWEPELRDGWRSTDSRADVLRKPAERIPQCFGLYGSAGLGRVRPVKGGINPICSGSPTLAARSGRPEPQHNSLSPRFEAPCRTGRCPASPATGLFITPPEALRRRSDSQPSCYSLLMRMSGITHLPARPMDASEKECAPGHVRYRCASYRELAFHF